MYYRAKKEGYPNIWFNIDPMKVKQRIDQITQRLEQVRRSSASPEADSSTHAQSEQECTLPSQEPANKHISPEDENVNQIAKS